MLVLTPAGSSAKKRAQSRRTGLPKRVYEKSVKGYVYQLNGRLGASNQLQLPSGNGRPGRGRLGLSQRFLVVQVFVERGKQESFSIDVGFTDVGRTRRRLLVSSGFAPRLSSSVEGPNAKDANPLHAKV